MKYKNFKYKPHPCELKEKCPDKFEMSFSGKTYMFHFYINSYGRYVALCNTYGCENFHGEGAHWFAAASQCMERILKKKGIE